MTRYQAIRYRLLGPVLGLWHLFLSLFLPRSVWQMPYGRPMHVRLPLSDGWGQAVHPDVLFRPGKDPEFLLAFTPYPFEIGKLENPSLVVSADGLRFRAERPGLNPLVPAPPVDHNDDPDLVVWKDSYCILYLATLRPERQELVLLQSADRITWARQTVLSYRLQGAEADPFIVSPCLSLQGDTIFLHYVNTTARPNRIEFLTSTRMGSWDRSGARHARFDRLHVEPWHIDIIPCGEYAYMLLCSVAADDRGAKTYDLHIARSRDRESWTMSSRPVFVRRPFGTRTLYRSSALVQDGDLVVYFSYASSVRAWWIGAARLRLTDFFAE